jgi:hypothetical protein
MTTCLSKYYLTKYTVQQSPLNYGYPEDGPMRLKPVARTPNVQIF